MNQEVRIKNKKRQRGFTLMEILVATTIFTIVMAGLMGLFNYVLKINRRSEALRQASQGMRNFVEFLAKEVRNGQIDYYVQNGTYTGKFGASSPCGPPSGKNAGDPVPVSNAPSTYFSKENRLGIINTESVQECFYFGNTDGSYIDGAGNPATFATSSGGTLVLLKSGVPSAVPTPQILNPSNFIVQNLMFLIRPLCDPYTSSCGASSAFPHIQPVVTIIIKFLVKLPTGEQVPINYQTSVSSYKYDIP